MMPHSARGPSRATVQIIRCEALLFLVGEFPICKERGELEERIRRAAIDLSRPLDDECLGALHGASDIGRLQQLVKEAEHEWDSSRAAFERHRQEHGC